MPEKFNAVVLVRIVRSGEDDARIGAQGARDIGDAGSGQRADHKHIHAQRSDPGDKRIFQHVAGEPGVLAEHNLWSRAARMRARIEFHENMCGGATELKRGLRRDGLDIGDAANAIRSKNLSVVAHPANSTSRCDIRKLETRASERFPQTAS